MQVAAFRDMYDQYNDTPWIWYAVVKDYLGYMVARLLWTSYGS